MDGMPDIFRGWFFMQAKLYAEGHSSSRAHSCIDNRRIGEAIVAQQHDSL